MSNPMITPHDKWQSFKCGCVYQNGLMIHGKHESMCDIPSGYLTGKHAPNYPVPALDYYNSANSDHIPIGNMMELAYPVELQLKLRG